MTNATETKNEQMIRPFFWFAVVAITLIYIDAILSMLGKPNVMKDEQWYALRIADFVLAVAVYIQAWLL